jgi:hypothetical protein
VFDDVLRRLEHRPLQGRRGERRAPGHARVHLAFIAPSIGQVDAFWRAGVAAGLADDGPPARGHATPTTTTRPSCAMRTTTASRRSTTTLRRGADCSTT